MNSNALGWLPQKSLKKEQPLEIRENNLSEAKILKNLLKATMRERFIERKDYPLLEGRIIGLSRCSCWLTFHLTKEAPNQQDDPQPERLQRQAKESLHHPTQQQPAAGRLQQQTLSQSWIQAWRKQEAKNSEKRSRMTRGKKSSKPTGFRRKPPRLRRRMPQLRNQGGGAQLLTVVAQDDGGSLLPAFGGVQTTVRLPGLRRMPRGLRRVRSESDISSDIQVLCSSGPRLQYLFFNLSLLGHKSGRKLLTSQLTIIELRLPTIKRRKKNITIIVRPLFHIAMVNNSPISQEDHLQLFFLAGFCQILAIAKEEANDGRNSEGN